MRSTKQTPTKQASKQPGPPAVVKKPTPTTYEAIIALKEEEIKQMDTEETFKVMRQLFERIAEEEEKNEGVRAKNLRDKLPELCKFKRTYGGLEDLRRQDWEQNHSRILSAIHNLVNEHYGFPTINAIAVKAQLSRVTVYEHLKQGIGGQFYQERLNTWEYLTDGILKNLYKESIDGNVAASKVLLDNIYRLKQPPVTNIKQQNNYLQINNTRIDEVTISELPDEARLQIENILTQYTKKTA